MRKNEYLWSKGLIQIDLLTKEMIHDLCCSYLSEVYCAPNSKYNIFTRLVINIISSAGQKIQVKQKIKDWTFLYLHHVYAPILAKNLKAVVYSNDRAYGKIQEKHKNCTDQ